MGKRRRRMGDGEAALKGALASLAGGLVMKMVWSAEQKALLPPGDRVESPTMRAVEKVAEGQSVQLSEGQTRAAAAAFYGGNMAMFGAMFGVVQNRLHPPGPLHGLALGALVYGANFPSFGVLPRLGIMDPPQEQSARELAIPLTAHVAYGLTTAAVFEALS